MRKGVIIATTVLTLCSSAILGRAKTAKPSPEAEVTDISVVDYTSLEAPAVGESTLHVLSPTLLELVLLNTKGPDPDTVTNWNFVENDQFSPPSPDEFVVTAGGQTISVANVGFKRRPFWAPFADYDLRIANSLYLVLSSPIATNQTVQVSNPDGMVWSTGQFTEVTSPLRYNPAIHVNEEGYMPDAAKQAMVGYYLGNLGEMSIPSTSFTLVNATTGKEVFQGTLTQRPDVGFAYSPAPYQQVYVADFSSFKTKGEYRLQVPGMGASLPFLIDPGIGMAFTRAYALGLYHQRCGAALEMPYTRFQHGTCHDAPVSVPTTSSGDFAFTWTTISNYAVQVNGNNPPQAAPFLTSPQAALFPFQNQGPLDETGGHHDAGDYSKYTINVASLVHYLMFEVDSLPGIAKLDNLGIPESGDGISDVMQECKWEADFLAKMQDSDGGFYFLVYPIDCEYEIDVAPDHGHAQVVWPKTSSATAASVAALAQCASSPLFKKTYPKEAALYLQKAQLGWQFLTNNIAKYGYGNFYQKITTYGDDWADNDEMAWAACQMFLATGDQTAHQYLLSWFDPSNPSTWRWGWWHMSECWGHAIRSYAFAAQSGRVTSTNDLNATFLAKCKAEILAAANDTLTNSLQSAYGTSLPSQTKANQSPGWYFSCDQAFDLAVGYQVNPNQAYLDAIIANMNYEGGCNPLNLSYVAGLGQKRQRNYVSQWEVNAPRALPPSGLPAGNVQTAFTYLWNYQGELEELAYPADSEATPYPFYDRWGDSWNVSTEMVCLNSARALGALGFLAAETGSAKGEKWKPAAAKIKLSSTDVQAGSTVTAKLSAPHGLNLNGARIVWEAAGQQPAYGETFTFTPSVSGKNWVEVEAEWPDGRRVFGTNTFNVQ